MCPVLMTISQSRRNQNTLALALTRIATGKLSQSPQHATQVCGAVVDCQGRAPEGDNAAAP